MSSLKKAAPSRTYQERHQPASRERFGLLEKHKDYVLRAREFHRKERSIRKLQEKAALRNPDEFYHRMISSRVVDGVHKDLPKKPADRKAAATEEELYRKYITSKETSERRKVEDLQSQLHFLEAPAVNQHTFFLESQTEVASFDPSRALDTHPSLVTRTFNRPRLSSLRDRAVVVADGATDADGPQTARAAAAASRAAARQYRELAARAKREQSLRVVRQTLDTKRHLASKGRRRIVSTGNSLAPPVVEFRKERKR